MTTDIKRMPFIDALRGYAILGVIVVHVAEQLPTLEWPFSAIVVEGARGVQLFFIASALSLMASWQSRRDGVAAFYIRRIFRVAPMFWLAIPAFVILNGLPVLWPNILATALFIHGFHPETIDSIVPGGWSIAAEMTFYAVFPLLVWSIRTWRAAALALIASIIGAALLYPITIEIFHVLTPGTSYELLKSFSFSWFPTQLPAFLTGFLAFYLLRDIPRSISSSTLDAGSSLAIAATIVLPLVIGSTKVLYLAYVLDFGLLAFCLGKGGGRFLVTLPIRYLGTISYSAYFWHFVVLRIVERLELGPFASAFGASGWLQFLVLLAPVIALTVLSARITYRLIEMPLIRLGRRVAAYRFLGPKDPKNAGENHRGRPDRIRENSPAQTIARRLSWTRLIGRQS